MSLLKRITWLLDMSILLNLCLSSGTHYAHRYNHQQAGHVVNDNSGCPGCGKQPLPSTINHSHLTNSGIPKQYGKTIGVKSLSSAAHLLAQPTEKLHALSSQVVQAHPLKLCRLVKVHLRRPDGARQVHPCSL